MIEHLDEKKFKTDDELFGVFERQGNYYGFNKNQLGKFLFVYEAQIIFLLYSGSNSLAKFQASLDHVLDEIKKKNLEDNPEIECTIEPKWVLIDAPPEDCMRRLKARNLPGNIAGLKRAHIIKDKNITLANKNKNFFDVIIKNSDNESFNSAVTGLLTYINDLLKKQ